MILALWVCVVGLMLAQMASIAGMFYQHKINRNRFVEFDTLLNHNNGLRSRDDMISGRLDDHWEVIMELKEHIEALEEGMERLGPIIGHRKSPRDE